VVIKKPEAMFLHELIPIREFKILAHHLAHEIPERGLRYPPQPSLRFRCIAEQRFNLGRPEIPRVNRDDALPGLGIVALFVDAVTFPPHFDAKSRTECCSPVAIT
jgi:hypothetical protein